MIVKVILCIYFPFVFGRLKYSRATKFEVPEDQQIGSAIGIINSSLVDSKRVTFMPIMRPPVDQYFLVDSVSGRIRLKRQLDRESICPDSPIECVLNFKVKVSGSEAILDVSVVINDINDNIPKFPEDEYRLKISESSKIGSELSLPMATDKDSESNGIVNYKIISDSMNKEVESDFKIILNRQLKVFIPILKQIKPLDRETISKYKFHLRAEDKDGKYGETLVYIDVDDANDNYPQWIGAPYHVDIQECDRLSQHLIVLSATDQDQGQYGSVSYKINNLAEAFVKNHFHLYGSKLFLSTNLDYEIPMHRKIIVPVMAIDEGGLMNTTNVEVRVNDCNDNSPIINIAYQSSSNVHSQYNSQYEKLSINENDDREINIVTIDVTDADSGDNSKINCDLETFKDHFRLNKIDEDNGRGLWLQLIKNQGFVLDREKMSTIKVDIFCKDNGLPPRSTRQSLLISVNDINDNDPKLISGFSFNIVENNENGALVGKFEGSDLDENENKGIEYNLIHESVEKTFHLTKDGLLYTNAKLDRESVAKYKLGISLTDKKEPRRSSFYNITVNVLDDNDGIPMYVGERVFRIVESYGESISQVVIGQLNATDSDEGYNGVTEFLLDSNKIIPEPVKHFYSISKNGLLTVRGNLDREKIPIHQLIVTIQDRGEKPQSTSVQITIHLLDINDNKPIFSFPNEKENSINITVDSSPGNTIGVIKAEDKDLGDNGTVQFECRPKSNYFTIDKNGDVILKQSLGQNNGRIDFQHTIHIRAYDLGNRSLQQFAKLYIYISDTQLESSRKNGESWESPYNNNDGKIRVDEPGGSNSIGQQKRRHMNIIILMIMVVLVMIIFFAVVAILSFIYFKKERFTFCGAASSHRNTDKPGTNYSGHKTNQPCEVSRMVPFTNLTNNPMTEYTTKEGIRVAQYNSETAHRSSSNFYNTLILPDSRGCTFQNNNDEYQNRNSSINSSDLHQKIALLDYSNFFESEDYRDHVKDEYFQLNHNIGSHHHLNNGEFNKRINPTQNQQRIPEPEDFRVDFKTPQLQKKSMKVNSSFV